MPDDMKACPVKHLTSRFLYVWNLMPLTYAHFCNTFGLVAGGDSLGCLQNAGAAGTQFDVLSRTLLISNNDKPTKTDTDLLAFPVRPLWGNVLIERSARILVRMVWTRIQVCNHLLYFDFNIIIGTHLDFVVV
jgi:hypothetical protein